MRWRRKRSRPGASRRALVAACCIAAAWCSSVLPGTATAREAAFAPLDRPGPKLSVDRSRLRKSLTCSAGVRDATREPVLLISSTGLDSKHNFSWNYQPLFDAEGIPWCASDQPGRRSTNNTDIQVRGEYLTYAIRRMHALASRRIAVVGHSQGGMAMRWSLRFWPDTRRMVADVIGLAGTNRGTTALDRCESAPCTPAYAQQASTSNFIAALNSRAETFRRVSYTEVYTTIDQIVTPQPRASSVGGRGRIANVGLHEVCPDDPSEHLAIGTISPTAAALVLDALAHRGPADPSRIDPLVCSQAVQPGVDPRTFGTDVTAALAQIGSATTPRRPGEPRLRCYVYADVGGCRQQRSGGA